MKITSPVKGFNEATEIGPYRFEFKDGVAEYDEAEHGSLNAGVKAYLKEQGYGLGSRKASATDAPPEPLDPRSAAADEQVGTKIRDAAVDPLEGDFLAPTNAGEANPHGSTVVSPEIHASEGVRPVKGGFVHVDDPAAQDAAEKAHATAATDGTPVTVTDAEKADQPDPLPTGADPAPGADVELKGEALDAALDERGLAKTGTADEKRARVAEHDEAAKGQG